MKRFLAATAAATLLLTTSAPALADGVRVTLRGSQASMARQNRIARAEDFSFLRTNREVVRFADAGRLVPVTGNEDYQVLAGWPYARVVVRDFVEVVARGYHDGCGEQLVVTSLTRPSTRQPANASPLSVHPAGMAVDLRVSGRRECVRWLESELLRLEGLGLIDGTREYYPPHFHVAVFPEMFGAYLAERAADSARIAAARRDSLAVAVHRELLDAARPAASVNVTPPTPSRTGLVLLGDFLTVIGWMLLRI